MVAARIREGDGGHYESDNIYHHAMLLVSSLYMSCPLLLWCYDLEVLIFCIFMLHYPDVVI
jgi:hypothetical protein